MTQKVIRSSQSQQMLASIQKLGYGSQKATRSGDDFYTEEDIHTVSTHLIHARRDSTMIAQWLD